MIINPKKSFFILLIQLILSQCLLVFLPNTISAQSSASIDLGKTKFDTVFNKGIYLDFDTVINPIYDSKNDIEFRLYSNYNYKSYRGVFVLAKHDTAWTVKVYYQEGKNTDFIIEPRTPSNGYKLFLDSVILNDAFGLPDWSNLDCKHVVYDFEKETFDTVRISFNNPWDFRVEFKIQDSFGYYDFKLPHNPENDMKYPECAILEKYKGIVRLFSNLE